MDGVLVDSEQFYHEMQMKFFQEIGHQPANGSLNDYVGLSEEDGWRLAIPDEKSRQQIIPQFQSFMQLNKIDYARYLNQYVLDFLNLLQKEEKKLAIASASAQKDIQQMIQQCNLEGYFDAIISGEEVVRNKPNPDIYLKALQELEIEKEEAVVIEDSSVGIQAAKAAGITTWAVKYPLYDLDQRQADVVLSGFGEVVEYYQKIR